MKVSDALERLKDHGYKYTGKREKMIQLFAEEERYIPAKEVLEHMQEDYPGLSFDTIYRNLSLFQELNILEETELDGEKRFRITCKTNSHHHHLICLSCGRTEHFHTCPVSETTIADQFPSFQVQGHKFEVYGTCGPCSANN
ncbi:Fur family transcriptional regulator [Alkalicoccobacillus porphyridii]|uniref:Transcriptional repressor n=1 Tax=Alkalicoccobacillus porphyridii TaxID=2597270 RepID=A0A553ZZ68_9BACI|nr:Fur family transcriptional regulator [Alkalicoccobacillus porphyridii]TSB46734.1 transcriptional repressor [Alkalicoccobacillus porphyridii]